MGKTQDPRHPINSKVQIKETLFQRLFFLGKGEAHDTISFYLSSYCMYTPHKPTRLIL